MKTVFLDLDGTLTDAGPGILNSVSYALEKMGYAPFEGDGFWMVGPPLWDSFRRLGVPEDRLDEAVQHYRDRYADVGWSENNLYEGILTELSTLKSQDYQLCIATSKHNTYARKITKHFGIADFMDYEFGSESDGTHADKTSLIRFGMAQSKAKAEQSIMVGDRHYDIIGAQKNGLRSVGVTYGYGGQQELEKAGATKIISKPTDLANAVRALL
ncbi:MAG: HAD hydrolase-like protein [Paracoccaceae bacterium]